MMTSPDAQTPCGAMFDFFKRHAHISHLDLCELVLSNRPLSDGRSPASRATDRSWVSRFIVHAPVGSLQERYFCDWGVAASRILSRMRTSHRGRFTNAQVIELVCGPAARPFESALAQAHQDVHLYRNALARLAEAEGLSTGERAESVLVLFVAAGCSTNVRGAVAYALDHANTTCGGSTSTPTSLSMDASGTLVDRTLAPLGLLPVTGEYVAGEPHWVEPSAEGVQLGALSMGENDLTDVGRDVSAHHAHLWCDAEGEWWLEDLGSTNGTSLIDGATGETARLEPHAPTPVHAGDTLRLGASTTYALIAGLPKFWNAGR